MPSMSRRFARADVFHAIADPTRRDPRPARRRRTARPPARRQFDATLSAILAAHARAPGRRVGRGAAGGPRALVPAERRPLREVSGWVGHYECFARQAGRVRRPSGGRRMKPKVDIEVFTPSPGKGLAGAHRQAGARPVAPPGDLEPRRGTGSPPVGAARGWDGRIAGEVTEPEEERRAQHVAERAGPAADARHLDAGTGRGGHQGPPHPRRQRRPARLRLRLLASKTLSPPPARRPGR